MKRMMVMAGTAALLLAMSTAQARPKPGQEVFEPGKPLGEQIDRIEKDLNDGETYSELKADQRSRVRQSLSRLRSVTERYPDGTAMPETTKVEQLNDQQIVNTVLTQAREDSRLICKREKATGSNRATTQCMTVAQRERAKVTGQKTLDDAQRLGNFKN